MQSDVPGKVRPPISDHWNAAGYEDEAYMDQPAGVVETHGYIEALISDALTMIEADIA